MIDLHTHILSGFDDGAKNLDESIEMAKQAVAEGIHTIVASPHIYDIYSCPSVNDILKKTQELNEALVERNISCEVLPGSEVHIAFDIPKRLKSGEILTVANNGRYLLLELPLNEVPVFTEDVIYELNLIGIQTIIAHPERNEAIIRKPEMLMRLIHMGALTQVSSGSLLGNFGKKVRHTACFLLKHNMLHIIASDGHSPKRRRIHMEKARQLVARVHDENYAYQMARNLPRDIINGQSVYPPKAKNIQWFNKVYYQLAMSIPR